METTSVRVTGARAIAQSAESHYPLQTVHGGCTCHQPVGYILYGRTCPESTGRVSRYHYQYRTYVPSPPPGYYVEDLPYPAARESGRQPELHAIPVQQDPVRFQPISANMGQPEFVLAPPPPISTEPTHAPASPAQLELLDEAAAYPATTGPSVLYTHSQSPRDGRKCTGLRDSKRPKGSGGEPLLLPPVHTKRQTGEQGLEDQHQ